MPRLTCCRVAVVLTGCHATGLNVASGYALGPSIDATDRFVLYFSGMRPEASAGKLDVYRVRYTLDHRIP